MIGEDLQKFSESRVRRTIAIGRLPIRNLPKIVFGSCGGKGVSEIILPIGLLQGLIPPWLENIRVLIFGKRSTDGTPDTCWSPHSIICKEKLLLREKSQDK
ncbi:hypothetical protein AVEN_242395-1 [Araneus ventricosus]|uniref:Uncharacterized protein n=1 Tax=Araneus ventricosus TaxID=182803 RepID=A0A4Y2MA99_ARAVE|nr:hypothetical protein AVEN_242395-1 [Araneus ventricosus]